ncbi:MAG: AAA family ATPase [Cyanobacteria bacterium J06635_11]
MSQVSMLYVFSGLPGTGKSTLAAALAQARNALYLRVDTIEQALKNSTGQKVGPEGYEIAYALAAENLSIGAEVVADSVNPLEVTRAAWRQAAVSSKCAFIELEIICSDTKEHRHRIETRKATVKGLKLPTWQQVIAREYDEWIGGTIVIDTAGKTTEQSIHKMFDVLGLS